MPFAWENAFLEALSKTGIISRACEQTGVTRQAVYAAKKQQDRVVCWRGGDLLFARAFDLAREESVERLEAEARRRAEEGVAKPVYQGGELVGHVQEYSDGLMQFLLKAARPDTYRDRSTVAMEGSLDVKLYGKDAPTEEV